MSQPTRDEIHDAWNRLILGRAFRIEYIDGCSYNHRLIDEIYFEPDGTPMILVDAGGSLHRWDQIRALIR